MSVITLYLPIIISL